MTKRLWLLGLVAVCLTCVVRGDYSVESRGSWPEDWPDELDSLRPQARTFEGPLQPLLHYAIPFEDRETFEAASPHLLKVKTAGAPIVLRRGPNFWLEGGAAGVCIHSPPAGVEPVAANPPANRERPESANYLELIVDGKIVDLNRIAFPSDTLIIDQRFESEAR